MPCLYTWIDFFELFIQNLNLTNSNQISNINSLNISLSIKSGIKFFHDLENFLQPFYETWVFLRVYPSIQVKWYLTVDILCEILRKT